MDQKKPDGGRRQRAYLLLLLAVLLSGAIIIGVVMTLPYRTTGLATARMPPQAANALA